MIYISNMIIPLMVLGVIIYGVYKKAAVYDLFIDGAKEGLDTCINIFPFLLGMIMAIEVFLNSGVLTYLLGFLSPVLDFLQVPNEIVPLSIMRPISGTSALALLNNILEVHGPDSMIGRLASVIQGSTDTTLYILTLYFGSIKIKNSRFALKAGLLADFAGVIASILLINIFF